jgi:hypothetical protein
VAEFEVTGNQYRSRKMTAFQQFHVARKLGPIFAKIGPSAQAVVANPDTTMVDLLAPIIDALAAMPEDDCNYILHHCLAMVQRFQGGSAWANVWSEPAKRMIFEDIDLAAMVQITLEVLKDNLGNFMNMPAQNSSQPPLPESSTPANLSAFPMVKTG